LPQKGPPAFVSILQSLAAAEIANMRYLRDFRSAAISEFFNTIGAKRTFCQKADVSFVPIRPCYLIAASSDNLLKAGRQPNERILRMHAGTTN
jgi:hypothetical protein